MPACRGGVPGLIFTFAYDRTVPSSFIGNLLSVVETNGGQVLFVELKCSPEELERRITHPSRQEFGKLNSLDQFRELGADGAFVDPGIPAERLVVDITELPAGDAARLIADKFNLLVS